MFRRCDYESSFPVLRFLGGGRGLTSPVTGETVSPRPPDAPTALPPFARPSPTRPVHHPRSAHIRRTGVPPLILSTSPRRLDPGTTPREGPLLSPRHLYGRGSSLPVCPGHRDLLPRTRDLDLRHGNRDIGTPRRTSLNTPESSPRGIFQSDPKPFRPSKGGRPCPPPSHHPPRTGTFPLPTLPIDFFKPLPKGEPHYNSRSGHLRDTGP